MEKLKFNPDNKKYYSEEFIKGFECGVERQFNADIEEKTAEWIDDISLGYHISICSNCNWRGHGDTHLIYKTKYCPNCGSRMKGVEE